MKSLLAFSQMIDRLNRFIGQNGSLLLLLAVIISTINAVVRKLFNVSSNAWLEVQWLLFGAVFMLCAAWTLLSGEHIRIDIINSKLSKRVRNIIELVGHSLFLIPVALVMIYTGLPFFLSSFAQNEMSMNAGGLPQWPAKSLIFIGFGLLFLQGVSELIKRVAIMRGDLEDTSLGGGHHAAAEAEAERLLAVAKAEAEKR